MLQRLCKHAIAWFYSPAISNGSSCLTWNSLRSCRFRASFVPRPVWAWDTETGPPQETLWSRLAAAQHSPPTSLEKTWKANWPSGAFWSFRGNCSTTCSSWRWLKRNGGEWERMEFIPSLLWISLSNNWCETSFKSNKQTNKTTPKEHRDRRSKQTQASIVHIEVRRWQMCCVDLLSEPVRNSGSELSHSESILPVSLLRGS